MTLTGLTEVGVLLWVFLNEKVNRSRLSTKVIAVLCLGLLLSYMLAYSALEFVDGAGARGVRGFVLHEEVQRIVRVGVFSIDQALAGAQYDPFRIWKPWSVHLARVALVLIWILFVASLALLFGKLAIQLRTTPLRHSRP